MRYSDAAGDVQIGLRLCVLLCLVVSIFARIDTLQAQEAEDVHPKRVMTAVRVNPLPPKIDGVLDDDIWSRAPISTGFTQVEPNEGEPATEKTTVQVAYDNGAVYFGIMCYDSQPEKITARLGRRDQWIETDQVSVNLDAHHDHHTGFAFSIGPSGWKRDCILFNDGDRDQTWDGVWEARASIHDRGWSAEYRIPYHILRFSERQAYVWGVTFTRRISRKSEDVRWVFKTRKDAGWVSKFGHLEGIKDIQPPGHLEFVPYAMGRSSFMPESDAHPNGRALFSTVGMDIRYGISSNISLNAAINPDFGQVEADPAVLNLGVFETFFEERRPFFIEGRSLFQYPGPGIVGIEGPARLFHSRRVGKRPGRFSAPDDSEIIDRPDGTTILGAVKLSGKTAGKTSISILEAVTGNEYATIEETVTDPATGLEKAERRTYRIEPVTNFLAGRVQQDIRANATAGVLVTAVNGQGFDPAYVGSIDGELKWKKNAYRLFTRLSGSRSASDEKRDRGYEAVAYFSKSSGWLGGQVYMDARSPGFDSNALGFMNRNDRMQMGAHVYVQLHDPWLLARRSGFNVNVWQHWNYDRVMLRKGVNFNTWHDLKNYWWYNFGINREYEAMDDLATRGGPMILRPAGIQYWAGFGTDDRKPVSMGCFIDGGREDGGQGHEEHYSAWVEMRPASNIQLEVSPRYSHVKRFAQWVENIDDDDDGEDDRFVFGELQSQVLDLTARASISFTPDMSLQLYLQSFVTAGDYGQIKELARPGSYRFVPFSGLDENPDFSRRSLKSNLVFRWEYRPGSAVFVVWSQSRGKSLDVDNPLFEPRRGLRRSFTDEGDNIFLVKINYWMGI